MLFLFPVGERGMRRLTFYNLILVYGICPVVLISRLAVKKILHINSHAYSLNFILQYTILNLKKNQNLKSMMNTYA